MANGARVLFISDAAKDDLESIFEYGFYRFGESQALIYLDSFDQTFALLQKNPLSGKVRNDLQMEIRSFVHRSHVVFYDFTPSELRVIRVLHHSQDVPKSLSKQR